MGAKVAQSIVVFVPSIAGPIYCQANKFGYLNLYVALARLGLFAQCVHYFWQWDFDLFSSVRLTSIRELLTDEWPENNDIYVEYQDYADTNKAHTLSVKGSGPSDGLTLAHLQHSVSILLSLACTGSSRDLCITEPCIIDISKNW